MTSSYDPSSSGFHHGHPNFGKQTYAPGRMLDTQALNELEDETDPETMRLRREALNGYYRESMAPVSLHDLEVQEKYSLSAGRLTATTKKSAVDNANPLAKLPPPTVTQIAAAEIEEVMGEQAEIDLDPTEDYDDEIDDIAAPHNSLDVLSAQIDRLYVRYQAEHSKGDGADIDKLSEIFMEMMAVWQRATARHDHELSLDMTDQLHGHVQRVKNTYNHIGGIIFAAAAMLLQIAGGIGGMVGGGVQLTGGTRAISLDKARYIIQLATSGKGIGDALALPKSMFDEKGAGERTVHEHRKTEQQRRRDDSTQKGQQGDGRSRDSIRNLQELAQIKTRKRSAIMGGGQDG